MPAIAAPRLSLLSFGPAWGCPSLDAASCKAHAYLLFCGLQPGKDFAVEPCNNPHVGLSGELPVLQVSGPDSGSTLAEPHEIFNTLSTLGYDPDSGLTALQKAESAAFTALIEERLAVALLFSWWEEEANYDAVIRPALAATLPLPLCYYLPWSMRRRVHSQLARRRCASASVAYAHGEAALEALAVRLDGRAFIHGDAPTSVDASAFAYLTAVLRCPLPDDRLRRLLRGHPNLVAYCERISADYFGGSEPLLPPASGAEAAAAARRASDIRAVAQGGAAGARAAADAAEAEAEAEAAGGQKKQPRNPKQQAFRRRSRNAVLAAAGSALAYALAVDAFGKGEAESEDEEA